jgi:hypothetical protein
VDTHHFKDVRGGGAGIGYASLNFAPYTIARIDGGGALAVLSLESVDDTDFILNFQSPTHGSGYLAYNHQTNQQSMLFNVEGSVLETLYGHAQGNQAANSAGFFGDIHIMTGGGADGIRLYGTPTGFRQQFLQDATGTIALTSQLPASLANASHKWLNSYDASTGLFTQTQPAYSDLTGTPAPILSGTTPSIGGSSLAAGACVSDVASVASTTSAMAVAVSPVSDPGAGFTWNAWVSASGTVTVRVCNVSGATATPTASAYNVRVNQ